VGLRAEGGTDGAGGECCGGGDLLAGKSGDGKGRTARGLG
jgi:hypothetical protein